MTYYRTEPSSSRRSSADLALSGRHVPPFGPQLDRSTSAGPRYARLSGFAQDATAAPAVKMFAAIKTAQPEGIRYASCLPPYGETFVALLQVDDGVENPLPDFREFREFLDGVEGARAEPANVQPLTVIGSYRFF